MRILYLAGDVSRPHTGGMRYNQQMIEHLSRRCEVVNGAEIDLQSVNKWRANMWCLHQVGGTKCDAMVEDAYYYTSLFLCNWVSRLLGVRIVVLMQAIPPYERLNRLRQMVHRILTWLFLKPAHLVIANSAYTRDRLKAAYWIRSTKTAIVSPAGQPLPRMASIAKPYEQDDTHRIISVANIQPKKGQAILVQALALLANRYIHVTIAGLVKDPKYSQELTNVIRESGLEEQISLVGFVEGTALDELYSGADIFVHPTLWEGYGMVILEAMSYGLPVIASCVGGIPEIVTDGVDGLLVPPGDPQALAAAIQRLLDDPALRQRLSVQAIKRAQSAPTWEQVGQEFYDLVANLAHGGGRDSEDQRAHSRA